MRHWLAHQFGLNRGTFETFRLLDQTYVCFRCACGRRSHVSDISALLDYDWDHIG